MSTKIDLGTLQHQFPTIVVGVHPYSSVTITAVEISPTAKEIRFDALGATLTSDLPITATPSFNTITLDVANADIVLSRAAANVLQLASGDSFRLSNTGELQWGTDIVASRAAADTLQLAAGDSFRLATDGLLQWGGTAEALERVSANRLGWRGTSFVIDSDATTNRIGLSTAAGAGNFLMLLQSATLTADRTVTFQDVAGTVLVTGGTDVVVADGGTGVSSFTAFAVICGGTTGTGALQSIAGLGTSGQILTSNGAGALPTFQAAATLTSGSQTITTAETTTSTTYTDLATSGPAVTLSPGAAQNHLILIAMTNSNNTANTGSFMSVAIAGAAAADVDAALIKYPTTESITAAKHARAASVANGSTHTAKYRVAAGTGTFENRRLSAISGI